jgi:hypothetical protein
VIAPADTPIVPGHGAVVDPRFVADQRSLLAAVAEEARRSFRERRPVADTAARLAAGLGMPDDTAFAAAERAYRQLRDEPAYPDPTEIRTVLGLDAGSTWTVREG